MEGFGHDRIEEPGQAVKIQGNHNHNGGHIDNGHDGHEYIGDFGNAAQSAEDGERGHAHQQQEENPDKRAVSGQLRARYILRDGRHGRYGIEALSRNAEQGIDDIQQAQSTADNGSTTQKFSSIAGQSADVFIPLLIFVNLRER